MNNTVNNKGITNYDLEDSSGLEFFKGCANGLLIVMPFWIIVTITCYLFFT
ncbi:hypothetical protein [Bacillus cereus]|uniref:hypothetical protein n=1 Tax=Bacillus cereus TaxID=1396 RepID=UPI00187949DA|nr:hypothetical protein [Bacillus cereus]